MRIGRYCDCLVRWLRVPAPTRWRHAFREYEDADSPLRVVFSTALAFRKGDLMAGDEVLVSSDSFVTAKEVWKFELLGGVLTVVLGLILALHPSTSFNVVAVFIGILLILGGVMHFVRALDREERNRAWIVIAGLLEVIIGVVMIRHLHLTKAVVGLLIGITWIVQGLVSLLAGIVGGSGSRLWWILFGLVSLIAGIWVVSVPQTSVNTLATLLGIWFIIIGVLEFTGGLMLRSHLAAKA